MKKPFMPSDALHCNRARLVGEARNLRANRKKPQEVSLAAVLPSHGAKAYLHFALIRVRHRRLFIGCFAVRIIETMACVQVRWR